MHLLPPRLVAEQSDEALASWLAGRVLPKSRVFADAIIGQAGLSDPSTIDIISFCRGLSVTDSYWVVPEDFGGSWKESSLFGNELDETFALAAYSGAISPQKHGFGLSPEWTTNGSYPKAWRRIDGELCLYKAGNYPLFIGANKDLGSYSEHFAAQAAEAAGLDHVAYGLDVWEGHLASVCRIFSSEDYAYVPFYEATGHGRLLEALAIAAEHGGKLLGELLKMLAFDSIIANDDRHGGNYGFLRDMHTGRYVAMAPLFDHNRSLFPTAMPSDFASFSEAAGKIRPAGSDRTFGCLLKAGLVTPEMQRMAERLLDFRFTQHPRYRFDEERLCALTGLVQRRASFLLECPARDAEEIAQRLRDSDAAKGIDCGRMPLFVQERLSPLPCMSEGQTADGVGRRK